MLLCILPLWIYTMVDVNASVQLFGGWVIEMVHRWVGEWEQLKKISSFSLTFTCKSLVNTLWRKWHLPHSIVSMCIRQGKAWIFSPLFIWLIRILLMLENSRMCILKCDNHDIGSYFYQLNTTIYLLLHLLTLIQNFALKAHFKKMHYWTLKSF